MYEVEQGEEQQELESDVDGIRRGRGRRKGRWKRKGSRGRRRPGNAKGVRSSLVPPSPFILHTSSHLYPPGVLTLGSACTCLPGRHERRRLVPLPLPPTAL